MTSSQEQKGTLLVTGANGGLGSAIVSHTLSQLEVASNYVGLYTVRKASTASALNKVLSRVPESHKHEIVEMDLGSIASVRRTAAEINRRVEMGELPPIRTLILNAGYQDHTELNMSEDDYEMTWQVNYLANQLLVLLILQSIDKENGRILIIGSWSHDIDDTRNNANEEPYKGWSTLHPGAKELAKGEWSRPDSGGGWLTGFRRYGASKLCAVMLMHELAIRLGKDPELSNITVYGLDPGAMGSNLLRRGSFFFRAGAKATITIVAAVAVKFSPNGMFRTTSKSAQDAHRLCWEVDSPTKGELLYVNGTDKLETSREAKDETNRQNLWKYGLEAVSFKEGETVLQNWQ